MLCRHGRIVMVENVIGQILFFSESLTLLSGLGIVLILAAVILLNRKPHNQTT